MEKTRSGICRHISSYRVRRPWTNPLAVAVFTTAGIFGFGTAMAQAEIESGIEQTGTQNSAEIDQQPMGSSLYAFITQDGEINEAAIRQVGPVEMSLMSEVRQIGTSNSAVTDQNDIERSATLSVHQSGNDNTTIATQTAGLGGSGTIDQSGDLNSVNLYQTETHTIAVITQYGTTNSANVEQSGETPYTQGAIVYQEGDSNSIQVLQDVMGTNQLDSVQFGTNNYTEVHQWQSPDVSFGTSHTELMTNGNDNQVYVEQANNPIGDFTLEQSGNSNLVTVYQGGEGADTHIVSQHSDHNTDSVYQLGLSALIEISRYYTTNSSTEISQASFNDTIFVEQGYADGATAIVDQWSTLGTDAAVRQIHVQDVLALVDQTAIESMATIEQTNNVQSSTAAIRQYALGTGGSNELIASIYQSDGTDISSAEIEQRNFDNVALIKQSGVTDASASIWQNGISGYAEIIQTGLDGGMSNTAAIMQSGEGYSASIHQDGSYNDAAISQM